MVQERARVSVLDTNVTAWKSSIVSHDKASHSLRKREHTLARADYYLAFLPTKVTWAKRLALWVSTVGDSEVRPALSLTVSTRQS